MRPITAMKVHFVREMQSIPLGILAYKQGRIFFEYDRGFLQTGMELSPFKLPLKPGVFECKDFLFEGLFGLFADSLPDGWGRLLLDRKLSRLRVNPESLTPLDRLAYVGTRGMGALRYEPEISSFDEVKELQDLDQIAFECQTVLEHDEEAFVDHLLSLNGSSAGARPKILVSLNPDLSTSTPSDNKTNHSHHDWIIKFSSSQDPKDIGPIEYAYHLMARAAGVEVPSAKLFKSSKGPGYFGVKRFDRTQKGSLHMHTVSGLLHADYRYPSLTYETLMKATLWLTKSMIEVEKRYRQVVFNVFSHNRDDHAKNFSFLMGPEGSWHTSPAYDLTFSSGPAGEHATTVMGEGRNPTKTHLLKLAIEVGMGQEKALKIIDEVRDAVSKWPLLAEQAHVSPSSMKRIASFLHHS